MALKDYSLKEFKHAVKNIARPNRFTVEIIGNIWRGVNDRSILQERRIKFYANKSSIPQFDVVGPVFNYRGTHVQLAGDYKREPLSIGFYNDETWEARALFEDWIRATVNYDSRNRRARLRNYRFGASVEITQYGNGLVRGAPAPVATYVYHDAVPLSLSNIALDHGQQNTIEEFDCIFHYARWERKYTIDSQSQKLSNESSMDSAINKTDVGYERTKGNSGVTSESETGPAGLKVPVEQIIGLPTNANTGNVEWDRVSDAYITKFGRN